MAYLGSVFKKAYMEGPRFNIRVYGLLIENNQLLITDEIRVGVKMTKLPGGGLQFGEGLEACLRREFEEELGATVSVGEIFYVNPFLQISAFRSSDEIIALYFWVQRHSGLQGAFSTQRWDFPNDDDDQQIFRWVPMDTLDDREFTFPLDKAVVKKLRAWWDEGGKASFPASTPSEQ